VGPALRSGAFLIQRAADESGRVLRVIVDVRRSQVIAIEGAPRGAYAGYAPYGPYRRPYPAPGADQGLAPPGSLMGWHEPNGVPPRPRAASVTPDLPMPPMPGRPKAKSVAAAPSQHPLTPTPRRRPAAAPQQAAGSIEPVPPAGAAPPAPPAQAAPAPAPAAPAKPAGSAMPPVAPLE
jgi:hypothetical protein